MALPQQEKVLGFIEELSKKYEQMELTSTQELAVLGYVFIRERAESLGLNIADFEPLEVIDNEEHEEFFRKAFNDHPDGSAVYNHEKNSIGSKYKPDLVLLTHEEIHYFSATENIPDATPVEKRMRSGFNSTHEYGEGGAGTFKDSFRYFNEGITDKLAFDLYKDSSPQDIGKVYEKVFPEKAEKKRAHYSENLKNAIEIVEKKRERLLSEADGIADLEERAMEERSINESIDSYISRTKNFWGKQSEVYVSEDELSDLKGEENSPYKPFIDLVSNMVEGMALSKNISEQNSWEGLQKAYFSGNIMYLREFEKIYGEGFLRKMGTLDMSTIENGAWKEWEEVEEIVNSKNEELRKAV